MNLKKSSRITKKLLIKTNNYKSFNKKKNQGKKQNNWKRKNLKNYQNNYTVFRKIHQSKLMEIKLNGKLFYIIIFSNLEQRNKKNFKTNYQSI